VEDEGRRWGGREGRADGLDEREQIIVADLGCGKEGGRKGERERGGDEMR